MSNPNINNVQSTEIKSANNIFVENNNTNDENNRN